MRVFVAIGLPRQLQDSITAWAKTYEELPVRWIAGKNLHITLVPPWQEDDVDAVRERLSTVLDRSSGPFRVHFSRVTFGPRPREPRLIWAVGDAPAPLIELRENVHAALEMQMEERPFRAHLTLARFRAEDLQRSPVKTLDEKIDWHLDADSFVLMESRLSRSGADYEILAEFKL